MQQRWKDKENGTIQEQDKTGQREEDNHTDKKGKDTANSIFRR